MTSFPQHNGLARTLETRSHLAETALVSSSRSSLSVSVSGSGLLPKPASMPASVGQMKSCATAAMLQTLTSGLAAVREPRMVRERF